MRASFFFSGEWIAGWQLSENGGWGLGEQLNPSKIKMGRQPRSGDFSLAIGPLDPEADRR
jgi:hypothetical protein